MPAFLAEWLQALGGWPGATLLRQSTVAYATLNAAHILSIGLIVGSIATLDLRVLGLFRRVPLEALASPLSKVAATGVIFALSTGLALFSVRPLAYAQNPAFLAKVSLVVIGIANALFVHANSRWRDLNSFGPHWSLRVSAALSLLIWAAAVLAGRWIGFLQ